MESMFWTSCEGTNHTRNRQPLSGHSTKDQKSAAGRPCPPPPSSVQADPALRHHAPPEETDRIRATRRIRPSHRALFSGLYGSLHFVGPFGALPGTPQGSTPRRACVARRSVGLAGYPSVGSGVTKGCEALTWRVDRAIFVGFGVPETWPVTH